MQKSDAKGWRLHYFEARAHKYPACDSHPENDVLLQGGGSAQRHSAQPQGDLGEPLLEVL